MYSIVFLDYDPDGRNRETSIKSLQSIIEHSKNYDFELIHIKNVKGFVHAVNQGLTQSRGDYIVLVANDVILMDYDWLNKFTFNGMFSWRFIPFFLTGDMRPDFACWGLSREAFEKLGLMDIRFAEGYGFDDDDYIFRARELGIEFKNADVQLQHLEGGTYLTHFKALKQTMTERNEGLFREKWKL